MLRSTDIIKARDIVYTVASNESRCQARSGTPLSILNSTVRLMVVPKDDATGTETALSTREAALSRLSRAVDAQGIERHSVELGAIAKSTARLIANTLNFARNVVNPIVVDILEKAEKIKEDLRVSDGATRRVVPMSVSAVYNDSMLESLVERHTRLSDTSKPLPLDLANTLTLDISLDTYISVLHTGNVVIDAKIDKVLTDLEHDTIRFYLENGWSMSDSVGVLTGSSVYTNHQSLLAYFFLMGVQAGRLESIDLGALSGVERLAISEAISYFGYRVNQQLKQMDRDIASGLVILTGSLFSDIYVLNSTYTDWISGEGSNEAILGFMHSIGSGNVTVKNQKGLVENPLHYGAIYDRAMRNESAEIRIKINTAIDRLLSTVMYEYIQEEYSEHDAARKALQDKLENILSDSPYTHSIDLDGHVLKIVCATIANDRNDAYQILTTMRSYLMDNPEATPGTAALVAATKLVGRWIASQIEVVKY